MKPLVIFGTGDMAQLAHYYFTNESNYDVVAFTVDSEFMVKDSFCDLPIIPFENISDEYPPELFTLFIAIGYSKLNSIRKEKFLTAKERGYQCASFISPRATVLNDRKIGENCFVFEDNTIQPFVEIGDNVTLWSGNHIGHHSVIQDHTFIASHVVISGRVEVGEQCFIGVNVTLRDNIKLGERCIVGAGAILLKDAEADGVYVSVSTARSPVPSSRLRGI